MNSSGAISHLSIILKLVIFGDFWKIGNVENRIEEWAKAYVVRLQSETCSNSTRQFKATT